MYFFRDAFGTAIHVSKIVEKRSQDLIEQWTMRTKPG